MDKNSIRGCGGNMPARRFSFSWADEVEREEQELQQQQPQNEQPVRREEERERTKTDPFGAARPREVVLAEKGVDWRDRDRELDASHRNATCRTRAQGKRDARFAPAPTTPRRRLASSTPKVHRKIDTRPVSYSGTWSGKRKCAGEAPARQDRPMADQGRRIFGELNISSGSNSSRWSSKKSCNSAGNDGIEARNVAAADGENSRVPAMAVMMSDESGVGQKRMGKKRKGRKKRSVKTKKQQTLLL